MDRQLQSRSQPRPRTQAYQTLARILVRFLHANTHNNIFSRWQMPPTSPNIPRSSASAGHAQVPTDEFIQCRHLIRVLHGKLYHATIRNDGHFISAYIGFTARCLTMAIYEANTAEDRGLDALLTKKFCFHVFTGRGIDVQSIRPGSELYRRMEGFLRLERGVEMPGAQDVLRAVCEVVWYAKAYLVLIDAFLNSNGRLNVEVIVKAWRILYANDRRLPRTLIAEELGAGESHAADIDNGAMTTSAQQTLETCLARYVDNFTVDFLSPVIDPFFLAAEMCSDLATIKSSHVIDNERGRMSRMILNAVLMRYVGVVIAIGGTIKESELYKLLARESKNCQLQEIEIDQFAGFVLEQSWESLRKLMGDLPRGRI